MFCPRLRSSSYAAAGRGTEGPGSLKKSFSYSFSFSRSIPTRFNRGLHGLHGFLGKQSSALCPLSCAQCPLVSELPAVLQEETEIKKVPIPGRFDTNCTKQHEIRSVLNRGPYPTSLVELPSSPRLRRTVRRTRSAVKGSEDRRSAFQFSAFQRFS